MPLWILPSYFLQSSELEKFRYQVQIKGNVDKKIVKKFKEKSLLFKSSEVISITSLKNRYAKDKKMLKATLASYGYFYGQITYKIFQKDRDFLLVIDLKLDEAFKVKEVDVDGAGLEGNKIEDLLLVREGDSFNASTLSKGVDRLKTYLKEEGYPFVETEKPEVCVNYQSKTVSIRVEVERNQKRVFGDVVIKGLKNIKPSFIQNKLQWKVGEVYNEKLLDKTRQKLIASGIIGYASVKPMATDSETVPIRIKVYETPLRTFTLEGVYSTSEKWGGRASWEHKNLRGNGEYIGLKVQSANVRSHFIINNKIPHFRNIPSLDFVSKLFIVKEKTRAYSGSIYGGSFGLEKEINDKLRVGSRVKFEHTNILKSEAKEDIKNGEKVLKDVAKDKYKLEILSTPTFLEYSNYDDDLEPTKGYSGTVELTPNYILSNPVRIDLIPDPHATEKIDKSFIVLNSSLSFLLPLQQNSLGETYLSFFNKIKFGNIFSKDLKNIPPHKRFYLGGIRDMRAFGYKEVGEVDDGGEPKGGLSYGMWLSELRIRLNETYGLNLYYETGFVSPDQLLKDNKKKIFHGAGASFVYHTKIGPIQFGLALPFKRRKNYKGKFIDSAFQFYVGIGQIT